MPNPDKLSELLEQASELSEGQLEQAQKAIADIKHSGEDEDGFEEWFTQSVNFGNDAFWQLIEDADKEDLLVDAVIHPILRSCGFMLAYNNSMEMEKVEHILSDGWDMGRQQFFKENPEELEKLSEEIRSSQSKDID
tara:strand:+ start:4760 stop:5170 length:411 start_codon:yes stop_codon:yes gene_type:complete